MAKADLTAALLREILHYDPETGEFRWRVKSAKRIKVGDRTGRKNVNGYLEIGAFGRLYKAHRLAWLYVHGKWPDGVIDHMNGDNSDNRICNLRDVTLSVNMQNLRHARAGTKSGLLGVAAHKDKWKALIKANGKQLVLGRFDTPEAAHAAYVEAKRRLHPGCTI